LTPIGAVSRLEHALSSFEEERERQHHRLTEAERRLTAYRARQGGTFAFAGELAEKRRHLAEVEQSLAAADVDVDGSQGSQTRNAA
jgi:hypothetical protein